MRLPTWMRAALIATAAMHVGATAAFLPSERALRAVAGFPEGGHPFYMATAALFVLLFGLAYLYAGVTGRPDRLFFGVLFLRWLSSTRAEARREVEAIGVASPAAHRP